MAKRIPAQIAASPGELWVLDNEGLFWNWNSAGEWKQWPPPLPDDSKVHERPAPLPSRGASLKCMPPSDLDVMDRDRAIDCIKLLRSETGAGLRVAKNAYENNRTFGEARAYIKKHDGE